MTQTPEDLAAIEKAVEAGVKRHSSGKHMIVDAQGTKAPSDKKPWWKSIVPPFVSASLLGIVLGGGIAWGGVKAIVGNQDRDISEIKASAVALDGRVRITENSGAANTAQHEAMTEKIVDAKAETTLVKNEVTAVKNDLADLKRDNEARAKATDKAISEMDKKIDRVLSKLTKP